jgi:hypothetical protein
VHTFVKPGPKRILSISVAAALAASLGWMAVEAPDSAAGQSGSRKRGTLLASAPVLPDDRTRDIAVLATTKRKIRKQWKRFNLPGGPPGSVLKRDALFIGTSESGSCPEEFLGLTRVQGKKVVRAHIDINWSGEEGVCTDDFRPRTFVVGARHRFFPKGRFDLRIGDGRRIDVARRP